ncbi:polygalacturonase-like [Quillaja saponaria]|uniref:Polygalacturonase-like n=1 Tax=Quillaja saponaria TaxID=32244 RepID=A0AAD7P9V7_QUISA|nr:polygalacturonase-like [Quillaja saponaria]
MITLLLPWNYIAEASNRDYINVVNIGARPDGESDSTPAFQRAWSWACNAIRPSTIYVPRGSFLLKQVVFRGPCKNKITFQMDGSTLVAPSSYLSLGNSGYWILFIRLNRLAVYGGTLDARGAGYWSCRRAGKSCILIN